ncbi:PDZ domain-containing protein [candidate division KSB1 bacterium]|nr:PDZ domain-containing protein [candidate division KSB1 bacterium]
MKRLAALLLISTVFFSCATKPKVIFPVIQHAVANKDFYKFRKVAVLPFEDAPNSPNSGDVIQGLVNNLLTNFGFITIERGRLKNILEEQKISSTGLIVHEQRTDFGELLGINALVIGEVSQYETRERKTDTTIMPFMGSFIPLQGKQWTVSFVSLSLRFVDVETGEVLFSGAGHFEKEVGDPPQRAAGFIIADIIRGWLSGPGAAGYSQDDYFIINKILPKSPAEDAGLKVGDRIVKVNNVDLNNDKLKFFSLHWAYPGDEVKLEVVRNGKPVTLKIIMADRKKVFKTK